MRLKKDLTSDFEVGSVGRSVGPVLLHCLMILSKKQLRDLFTGCVVTVSLLILIHKNFLSQLSFHSNEINLKQSQITHKLTPRRERTHLYHQRNASRYNSSVLHNSNDKNSETKETRLPMREANRIADFPGNYIDSKHLDLNFRHQSNASKVIPSYTSDSFNRFMGKSFVCPLSVKKHYASQELIGSSSDDLSWCQLSRNMYHVIIGRSWGGLPPAKRKEWDTRSCNDLLKLGKLQTCDERYGWSFNKDWLMNMKVIVSGTSSVKCATNLKPTRW